jgi:hypothetical protein
LKAGFLDPLTYQPGFNCRFLDQSGGHGVPRFYPGPRPLRSLSADLGMRETAAAPRIADMIDHPSEPDDAGSADNRLWDVATIYEIDAMQRACVKTLSDRKL